MIKVTKTFLPPLQDYVSLLETIWETSWVTNHGPLVGQLEDELKKAFGAPHVYFMANGTVALQLAYRALGLSGEVITTPFSYVATVSTLVWEGLRPVLVDIEPETLTIDPRAIEAAITDKTTAILGTHVYGNPCDVTAIEAIAKRYGLKVVYDAAHAFGVRYRGRPLAAYGDVSTLSFHATKLFHTGEGGAAVTHDAEVSSRLAYLRNFGHNGEEDFFGLGINGKNSELHAAMGLCVLPRMPEILAARQRHSQRYDRRVFFRPSALRKPRLRQGADYTYAYYPILFASEGELLAARERLAKIGVHARRYFYPSLASLPYVDRFDVPIARDVSRRVLCLPMFVELTAEQVDRISGAVLDVPVSTFGEVEG